MQARKKCKSTDFSANPIVDTSTANVPVITAGIIIPVAMATYSM